MTLKIKIDDHLLYDGVLPEVTLKKDESQILMMYDVVRRGTNVTGGATGTTYTISYKTKESSVWFDLETFIGSGIQVGGTLSAPNVDSAGTEYLGYTSEGDTPLGGDLSYRINLDNDNVSGLTEVSLWLTTSVGEAAIPDPAIVISPSPYEIANVNGQGETYTFTGFPDIATMGLTIADLSVDDPNYPTFTPSFAVVMVLNNITSNGSNVAKVLSNVVIGGLDGTDLDTTYPSYTTNLVGRAGVANDSEDHRNYYVPITDGKIVWGINTVEEAGSNAFGQINVIGYAK